MARFKICGNKKLKGAIKIMGSKNAALPLICASILTQKKCTLKNVPRIEDVNVMIKLLHDIGVKINWLGKDTLEICAEKIKKDKKGQGSFKRTGTEWHQKS